MANLDTENKRRSVIGILYIYTMPPKPDATINAQDREQATYIYSGIAPGSLIVVAGRLNRLLLLGVSG